MNILPVKIENIYIKEMIFNDDNRMQNKFSFFYMPLIYLFFGTKLSDINFYEMGDYQEYYFRNPRVTISNITIDKLLLQNLSEEYYKFFSLTIIDKLKIENVLIKNTNLTNIFDIQQVKLLKINNF